MQKKVSLIIFLVFLTITLALFFTKVPFKGVLAFFIFSNILLYLSYSKFNSISSTRRSTNLVQHIIDSTPLDYLVYSDIFLFFLARYTSNLLLYLFGLSFSIILLFYLNENLKVSEIKGKLKSLMALICAMIVIYAVSIFSVSLGNF